MSQRKPQTPWGMNYSLAIQDKRRSESENSASPRRPPGKKRKKAH